MSFLYPTVDAYSQLQTLERETRMWIVEPLQLKDSSGKPKERWRLIARSDEDGGIHECCACKDGHSTAREASTCQTALERAAMISGTPQLTKLDKPDTGTPDYNQCPKCKGKGHLHGPLSDTVTVPRAMIEQFCNDLNQAHDELLKAQGCPEEKWAEQDWPQWTPQANSIRWAEELLGKPLSKRSLYCGTEERVAPACQITINGIACLTSKTDLSYEEVLTLVAIDPSLVMSMTYRSVAGDGMLSPGVSTPVVPGMIFNAIDTGNA